MSACTGVVHWKEKSVYIEFEGVYREGRVYINGDFAGGYHNGYSEFTVHADDFLIYGGTNTISVIANNSAEENSRWYSGSGIYRNVNLLVGERIHVGQNSVKITTPEIETDLAVVEIEAAIVNESRTRTRTVVSIELLDAEKTIVSGTTLPVSVFAEIEEHIAVRLQVDEPKLWSCETPHLYTCRVTVVAEDNVVDTVEETFGIRSISLSAKKGFRLNGKEVKLRGACIHHDNGVIGAVTLERAEERRVQQLKEAGFNCLRSSHHPMSREMLNACGREGMLVLDELSDVWTRSKNNNDYAQLFPDFWSEMWQQW